MTTAQRLNGEQSRPRIAPIASAIGIQPAGAIVKVASLMGAFMETALMKRR
ncbi:MAG: hypothetical protein NT072_00115 [Deltaproteobacteria bacterium]|nr:hypothetical protein [Deltaproteobacteria bacterium]